MRPLIQQPLNPLRFARNDLQIGLGCPVGLRPALFPVAEGAKGDVVADREFFLRQCRGAANDFACEVRFIRLRLMAVSGCASRSARAAASTAPGVMGLRVLLEVVILLILRRPSG